MSKYILFFLLILVFACSSRESLPDNVLPKEKMQAVLYDIFKADELANQFKNNDSAKSAMLWHTELYDKVFKLHKVSKEDFSKSFKFYQARPDLMKPMLEALSKKSDQTVKSN
jgi:hypothetical protein